MIPTHKEITKRLAINCFNLVIEKLMIPTQYEQKLVELHGYSGFNLVIEKLMIPTRMYYLI